MSKLVLQETGEGTELGCSIYKDPRGVECVVLDLEQFEPIIIAGQHCVLSWRAGTDDLAEALAKLEKALKP